MCIFSLFSIMFFSLADFGICHQVFFSLRSCYCFHLVRRLPLLRLLVFLLLLFILIISVCFVCSCNMCARALLYFGSIIQCCLPPVRSREREKKNAEVHSMCGLLCVLGGFFRCILFNDFECTDRDFIHTHLDTHNHSMHPKLCSMQYRNRCRQTTRNAAHTYDLQPIGGVKRKKKTTTVAHRLLFCKLHFPPMLHMVNLIMIVSAVLSLSLLLLLSPLISFRSQKRIYQSKH